MNCLTCKHYRFHRLDDGTEFTPVVGMTIQGCYLNEWWHGEVSCQKSKEELAKYLEKFSPHKLMPYINKAETCDKYNDSENVPATTLLGIMSAEGGPV